MNKRAHTLKYILFDFFAAIVTWSLFFLYRKLFIEQLNFGFDRIIFTDKFFIGIAVIPIFWLTLYFLSGYYKDIYRKSRLKELSKTFFTILVGVVILFFSLILDDEVNSYENYYQLFLVLFNCQFVLTYLPRLTLTTITNHKIHSRKIGFNTIIIGGNEKAIEIHSKIENQIQSVGNKFIGFIALENKKEYLLEKQLKKLGNLSDVRHIIDAYNVEEVIIAIESTEHREIEKIINYLDDKNVVIKAIASMYDILMGKVNMAHIFGTPLIQISHSLMPEWQVQAKMIIDFSVSLFALVLFSPLFIFLAIGVRFSSPGPIFYSHERIGRFGKPFTLYKFRSMYIDAEKNGPSLSSKNDSRITPFGKFLRKSKLDELPNFWNVFKGDMSLVGPRPERKFFIDQIVVKAPHYLHLQKVKPGITSWGQTKYGYAENIDQMVERLKYDILYIENMSLYVDFKIIIYTILTILKGRNI